MDRVHILTAGIGILLAYVIWTFPLCWDLTVPSQYEGILLNPVISTRMEIHLWLISMVISNSYKNASIPSCTMKIHLI